MKKCVIIMNKNSGKKKHLNYDEIFEILRVAGYETKMFFPTKKGEGAGMVEDLSNDIDLVISAGGDGTLNEVVTGNMRRDKKLVIGNLPLGSTNDVGSMYGFKYSIIKNLHKLLKSKPKKVDVLYINDNPYIYVAALGDFVDLAYSTPRSLKEKFGKLAYFIKGIKRIFKPIHYYNVKYKIDNKDYKGKFSFFFITNTSHMAGVDGIYKNIKLDDGKFEILFAKPKNKHDLIRLLIEAYIKDYKDIEGVESYQTDNLEIEFLDKIKTNWCIDGDELKQNSQIFTFRIEKGMPMLMPDEVLKKLTINTDI